MIRRIGLWTGRLLAALLAAAVVIGIWKYDEIQRLLAVNSIFAPEKVVANFSGMDRAFLHVDLDAGTTPAPALPSGPRITLPPDVAKWLEDRQTTSMVVLKDGAVVHETYRLGTGREDLRIGWSISKSYLSALAGIILSEGHIASLDDPVTRYAPSLAGGAYDGTTVRHVLTMTTGVTFDEDYTDKSSDINRMGRILAIGGEMDAFAARLTETFTSPGLDWQYVSIDTHVLAMVLRGATGRGIADLMGEKILQPLGALRAPYYLTDGAGVAFALGGINATTRDFARFGQMFAQGGIWKGRQIVPRDWVLASTTPQAPTDADEMGYGYQWWMPRDAAPREYMGRGIYGQYLYVDEETGVVIALTAVDPEFRDKAIQRENIAMFRAITAQLKDR